MPLLGKASLTGDLEPGSSSAQSEIDWARLIKLAKEGDRDALEKIVLSHEKRVLYLAWRLLYDLDEAKDAAQEVFVRLLKYLPSLDEQRNPSGWFYRTTVNVCRDVETRRRRWRWIPLGGSDGEEGDTPEIGPDLVERLSMSQEAAKAMRALRLIPAKERAVLVLRDIEGFETAEVAGILGSSETTVRSQASRARVRLKKIVEGMQ